MAHGVESNVPRAVQQVPHAWITGEIHAQRDRSGEGADEGFRFRSTVGRRRADDKIGLVCIPMEQDAVGGQGQHEHGHIFGLAQALQ